MQIHAGQFQEHSDLPQKTGERISRPFFYLHPCNFISQGTGGWSLSIMDKE
jgi:hypothetical protein